MARPKNTKITEESISSQDNISFLSNLINKFDDDAEIINADEFSEKKEWIGTGFYILNACLSGSLFGGITQRSYALGGAEGTGKSFVALSICREAQKQGYTPVYIDSEFAIDKDFVTRLGVDPTNFIIKRVNTINETSHFLTNLTKQIKDEKEKGKEPPKLLVVLDSLGNLTSDKEKADSLDGNTSRDMTKQQQIRALFRVNGAELGRMMIPFIICSHQYEVVGSYIPQKEISGGGGLKYNASVILMLSKSKLEDKESEKTADEKATKMGIVVTCNPIKQRFCKPIKVQFHIPFYKKPNPFIGLERFVSWENCGIVRGKLITEKEFSKLSDNEKSNCKTFTGSDGSTKYVLPKETARSLVCRHLEDEVPIGELWTEKVFSLDVLKQLDENIIKPTFELPNQFEEVVDDTVETFLEQIQSN